MAAELWLRYFCARLLRLGNQTLASEIQARLGKTSVHPAQLMAAAQMLRIDWRHAADLLGVAHAIPLAASAESIGSGWRAAAVRNQDRRRASMPLQAPPSADRRPYSPLRDSQLMRLEAAYLRLPAALDALGLEWAREVVAEIEAAQRAIDSPGSPSSGEVKLEASLVSSTAREQLRAAEAARRVHGSNALAEESWLSDPSYFPNAQELASVQALMRRYGIAERFVDEWPRMLWQDIRSAAQQDLANAGSGAAAAGAGTGRWRSSQSYIDFLRGDPAGFAAAAGVRLYPRVLYESLKEEAANGGVLRAAQLQAVLQAPSAPQKLSLAGLAYGDLVFAVARDWQAVTVPAQRPQYGDFMLLLDTPAGEALFVNAAGGAMRMGQLKFKARLLDFVATQDGVVASTQHSPELRRAALQGARSAVNRQIALIQALAEPLSGVRASAVIGQGVALLRAAGRRIDRALSSLP